MSTIHTASVPVRWSDFDRYGHMMNANYVELAQEARSQFAFERIYPKVPGFAVFVRHLELDFAAPIMPQGLQAVDVDTRVTRIGNTSFTTQQEIRAPHGPVACTVTCVQVAVDIKTQQPRPLTDEEKAILAETLVEGAGN